MKDLITDALRYWEPRRLVYNGVLAVIVVVYAWPVLPDHRAGEWLPVLATLFVFAVGANVAYCAAYPIDLFLQCSDFRLTWLRYRWGLFLIGLLLAMAITWLVLAVLVPW